MKIFFVFLLLVISVSGFSQIQETDTIELEPIDTNYTHPIGFSAGGGLMFSNISISGIVQKDTFSNLGTSPKGLFNIGILYNKNLSNRFSFQTGLMFNISKVSVSYSLNGNDAEEISNYSTAAVPLYLLWNPNGNKSGIFLTAGAAANLDISKKSDKNNRLFPMRTFSVSFGGALGYRIKTYASVIETRLFFKTFPFNILKNDDSIYSNALENMKLWSTGLLISIR